MTISGEMELFEGELIPVPKMLFSTGAEVVT
jgi:hypothetical protein